jgi:hypothetical protein
VAATKKPIAHPVLNGRYLYGFEMTPDEVFIREFSPSEKFVRLDGDVQGWVSVDKFEDQAIEQLEDEELEELEDEE